MASRAKSTAMYGLRLFTQAFRVGAGLWPLEPWDCSGVRDAAQRALRKNAQLRRML